MLPTEIDPLPYAADALSPWISRHTVETHRRIEHAYLTTLRRLVAGTPLAERPIEELARDERGNQREGAVGNLTGQLIAHALMWRSLTPSGGVLPTSGTLADVAERRGDMLSLRRDLVARIAERQFGSGWVWLLAVRDTADWLLDVRGTPNAVVPMGVNERRLLVVDVWEHAYLLDHGDRAAYVHAVVDHLLDWQAADERLAAAIKEHR